MRIIFFSLFILLLNYEIIYSQCSDAGVCTMGSLQSGKEVDSLSSNIILSQFIGLGEQETFHFTFQPEVNFKLFSKTELQIKIPYHFITGNLGAANGIGDISASISQLIYKNQTSSAKITLGTKIPLTQPTQSKDNLPLPMAYQSTVGTNDIIIGVAFFFNKWAFNAGYQHSFNRSSNSFLRSAWKENENAQKYFESNHLQRSDDVMLRAERKFILSKNKKLFIGLLPIYHLQKDIITDENGNDIPLAQSDGITVNLTGSILFPLKNNYTLKISSGNPLFLTRHTRPDGLTRTFNLGFHLERNF